MKYLPYILLLLVFLAACRHVPAGDITVKPTNTCSKDTVYFTNTILPLLVSSCAVSNCHDPITHEAGLDFSNYAGIMRYVVPKSLTQSTLYLYINSRTMPVYPVAPLSDTEIAMVKTWIIQGAKNNTCNDNTCDTAHVTYSGVIAPILKLYCTGCHNVNNAGGGIAFDNYTVAAANAKNGQLSGSIQGKAGFELMPKYGYPMRACDIASIRSWIGAGCPDN